MKAAAKKSRDQIWDQKIPVKEAKNEKENNSTDI